jgi:sulfite exporter TauE/SafE
MAYWTAFILGLVGSLHCAGMCGPLALALPTANSGRTGFFLGRLAYNLGRILTYSLLGVVFGLAGHALWFAGFQRWTSIALGLALLAGLIGSRRLALSVPISRLVERLKSPMSTWLRRRSFRALALLGMMNGLLPCGLVYVACAGAVSVGGTLPGASYMAVFGLGTLPMMLALSVSRQLVPGSLRLRLSRAVPVSVVVLGVLLILRGLSLGIPYLSPDLSCAPLASCCHF